MDTLDTLIERYQLVFGQLNDRARAHYRQGDEVGAQAKLVAAKIEALLEAKAALQESPAKPKIRQRQRMLSGPWQEIMRGVIGLDRPFTYDDLASFADLAGHKVGRDTLRSQMSGYKSGGLVQPEGEGQFRVTDAGKLAAGFEIEIKESGADAPKQNEPPEGGSDVDQASAGTAGKVWWANLSRPQGAGES